MGGVPEMAWKALTGTKPGYTIYGAPQKPERPTWLVTSDIEAPFKRDRRKDPTRNGRRIWYILVPRTCRMSEHVLVW